jgi:hypothetical protein
MSLTSKLLILFTAMLMWSGFYFFVGYMLTSFWKGGFLMLGLYLLLTTIILSVQWIRGDRILDD